MRSGHPQPQLLYHQVILASEAVATLGQLLGRWQVEHLVLGNQTTANQWRSRLLQELQPCPPMSLVDERYTTLEARDRYWQMYPPQGLRRLVPQGMRQPPRPVDDIVAILLIERYWSQGSA
jgi:RNase H-fold protein (predicted Holliday junction resolvase)